MGKKNISGRENAKVSKRNSHTGNKPLVPSLYNPNVMVSAKMRAAQEKNKS
tara:strand:+ start:1334 stop:1486 length:153 start_codon:yes stop_codon:yes gene_type:complete